MLESLTLSAEESEEELMNRIAGLRSCKSV
jgi:hypothetical protein